MPQPSQDPGLQALERFVGAWTIEAAGPDGQPWPGTGTATFEWHPSRAHVVQTTGAPGAPRSVSIMGCDPAQGTYVQLYSDDRGVCRIYDMRLDGDEWSLERVAEPFPQRFTGAFSADGHTISGRWEKAEDGTTFTLDFFLTYRREVAWAR